MIRRLLGLGERRPEEIRQEVVATVSSVDTPEEIQVLCRKAENKILGFADVLPVSGLILALRVIDLEREVLSLSKDLDGSTRYMMRQMLADYLPSLVDAFVLSVRSGSRDDKSFDNQVAVMVGSMEETLRDVHDDNIRGLAAQGIFLENKFGGSDLG